jgi:hypothetical protein
MVVRAHAWGCGGGVRVCVRACVHAWGCGACVRVCVGWGGWQMWISKDEYKDAGKVIVHRKCF